MKEHSTAKNRFPIVILNLQGQPKYASPTINLEKLEKYKQEILSPTANQLQTIARMCLILHIKQPIRENIKSQAEANKVIRKLEAEIKHRR